MPTVSPKTGTRSILSASSEMKPHKELSCLMIGLSKFVWNARYKGTTMRKSKIRKVMIRKSMLKRILF